MFSFLLSQANARLKSVAIFSKWEQQYLQWLHFLSRWQRPSGTTVLLIRARVLLAITLPLYRTKSTYPALQYPGTPAPLGAALLSPVKHTGILDRILDLWQTWKCLRFYLNVFVDRKDSEILRSRDTHSWPVGWPECGLTIHAAVPFIVAFWFKPEIIHNVNLCWPFGCRKTSVYPCPPHRC